MTRFQPKPFVILSALALFTLPLPGSAQKVALRWKYEPGVELVYRMTIGQQMDMGVMGGSTVTEQIQTVRWRVVEVGPDGDATVTVTTERVQADVQGPMGSLQFDSQSDEVPDNPQAQMFAAMAGTSFTMVVDPRGTVRSVQGFDELREKMLESLSAQGAPMLQGMIDQMFSEENLTRMTQQSIQMLPQDPVGPGDSWQSSFNMAVPMAGEAAMNMDFTITDLIEQEGRTIARIATEGDLSFTVDPAMQQQANIDLSDTKISGGIQFDVDRGITVSSEQRMVMQMAVAAGAQQMSVGLTQTMNLELIEYTSGR